MPLIFPFDCYVIGNDDEIMGYIGRYYYTILYSSDLSWITYRQLNPDNYSFFYDNMEDGVYVGAMPFFSADDNFNDSDIEEFKRFASAYTPVIYSTAYKTNEFRIKGVNRSGYYFITDTLNVGTSSGSQLYDSNNNILGVGENIGSIANNNNINVGTMVVNTDIQIPLVSVSGVYMTFNSGRYLSGAETELSETLIDFLNACEQKAIDDPYEEGGTSGTGGGTGTFSGTGDAIAIPSLPTLSAVDAGFITLFNPSITQLGNLASYMWSDLFDIDGWRKIFADPMNAILGLSIVPVNVPSGNVKTVKVGNISTGVSMTVASSQYVEVDCGTLNVKEFWGAYLDYDPYTKAEIYLPYIGTHALAVDDIMGKSVHVVYHVDVLSGACCAYVQCGGTVLYTFIGQCSSSIPITGDNWTNVINGAISIAGSIGSMVATGGVSAPMEIGNIASTAVNTMKPSVEKSGAMGGTGGMLGVQTPYLILTRPRQALPARQNTFTGYPSFITEELSTLSGYTEVFKIHLENVPATEQELSEIETLLKTGVIF